MFVFVAYQTRVANRESAELDELCNVVEGCYIFNIFYLYEFYFYKC